MSDSQDPKQRSYDYCFTLNNPTDHEEALIKVIPHRYLTFGHEIAPTTGTPHLQGYIYFKNPRSFSATKKSFPLRTHLERRLKWSDPKSASVYCTKEDLNPFVDGDLPEKQGSQGISKTLEELRDLFKAGKTYDECYDLYLPIFIRYPKALKDMYERYRPKPREPERQLRPFQLLIDQWAQRPTDSREVLWIYSTQGSEGKTTMAHILQDTYGFVIYTNAKTADVTYNWQGENVVFDHSRSQVDHINYEIIEQLKDGRVFSPKYESTRKHYQSPKVIVFSNYPPDTFKLSEDRWVIYEVDSRFNPIYRSTYYLRPQVDIEDESKYHLESTSTSTNRVTRHIRHIIVPLHPELTDT